MKYVWNWFLYLLLLASFPFLAFLIGLTIYNSYQFWAYGEDTEATIMSLERTQRPAKGVTSYYYNIQIDTRKLTYSAPYQLPIGATLPALLLPHRPNKVLIGNTSGDFVNIFIIESGAPIFAILTIIAAVALVTIGPFLLMILFQTRTKFIYGKDANK